MKLKLAEPKGDGMLIKDNPLAYFLAKMNFNDKIQNLSL
jgi:hypothetical protein